MKTIKTLRKKIYLDSCSLNPNIINSIKDKLKHEIQLECTKEDGYFLSLKSIEKIESNFILSDCNVYDDRIVPSCQAIFTVVFKVVVFKPEVDMICEGTVYSILPTGILLEFYGKQKALIPVPIKGYAYKIEDKIFENIDSPSKYIGIGDNMKMKFKAVKYKDKKFTVFGTLED